MFNKFWNWYQNNYLLILSITTLLFFVQIFHLYWLFTDIIVFRLTGKSAFVFPSFWGALSTFLDYTEIPAIVSTSILYIHFLREKFTTKNFLFLLFINIQWLHILWITDEIVVETFTGHNSFLVWSATVAWLAILIDYLELPIIYDTVKKTIIEIKRTLNKSAVARTPDSDPENEAI
ncbi:MAG: hypothetical protein Q8P83_00845 [bacterium]|nr:hypothetical protein [bacterium]